MNPGDKNCEMNPGDIVRLEFHDTAYMHGEYVVVDVSQSNAYLVELGAPWESAMVHCVARHEYDLIRTRHDDDLILETIVGLQRFAQTPAEERDEELGEDRYDRAAYVANVLLDVLDRKHDGEDVKVTTRVFRSPNEFFDYLDKLVDRLADDLGSSLQKLGYTV